jgi:hypothetical protein
MSSAAHNIDVLESICHKLAALVVDPQEKDVSKRAVKRAVRHSELTEAIAALASAAYAADGYANAMQIACDLGLRGVLGAELVFGQEEGAEPEQENTQRP